MIGRGHAKKLCKNILDFIEQIIIAFSGIKILLKVMLLVVILFLSLLAEDKEYL